ncbi:MAG: hypothetical protein E7399_07360 [Ruminococcaceae bacterium]|nr:hypothetical protein [Oscillospiraceae bacterium]
MMKKIMKRFGVLLLLVSVMLATVSFANNDIKVTIDGEYVNFDVKPQIINKRTMVPLRAIFEALGADVTWNDDTKTVIAVKDDVTVKATIGSTVAYWNDVERRMDVAPVVIDGRALVPVRFVAESFECEVVWSDEDRTVYIKSKERVEKEAKASKIIVLDPGHGKSSSLMSEKEKIDAGYTYIPGRGWGEWRHFKSGTMWQDCEGFGCSGRAPKNGGCWYPITAGDRDTEPDLNYNNALNAKKYLEQMGYTVRLTRGQNDNPSITDRIKQCYPDGNTNLAPDAAAYICIHANAGGGRGSCYISLSGLYDQSGIPENYIQAGNMLGQSINNQIIQNTSMPIHGNGIYTTYPELILFCKSPVPVAYMEIGFYDNASDLWILQNESDGIGKSIAQGIDAYYEQFEAKKMRKPLPHENKSSD